MFDGGNERTEPFGSTGGVALRRHQDVVHAAHASSDELRALLAGVAQAVVACAGFGWAVVSIVQPDGALEAVAAAGTDRTGPSGGDDNSVAAFALEFTESDRSGLLMFPSGNRGGPSRVLPFADHPEIATVGEDDSRGTGARLAARLEGPGGDLLGLMQVGSRARRRQVSAEELSLLRALAEQAGLAVHLDRVRADAARQLRLVEAQREVTRAATSLDLEELAAQIALAARMEFDAGAVHVELVTSDDVPRAGAAVPEDDAELQAAVVQLASHEPDLRQQPSVSPDGVVLAVAIGRPAVGAVALRRTRPWTLPEQRAISRLAEDLGRRVHNARMHHRERAVGRRLRAQEESTRHMVANITHEMKNPLTSLNGHLELLATEVEPTHLVPMQRSTSRLLGLVDSFLATARAESEVSAPDEDVVNLSRLVRAEVDSAELLAQGAGVTLRGQVPTAPVFVRGQMRDLERIVVNLISNALKFTPGGGVVTVQCQREGAEGVLRVTDTGIGISAVDQERLFERYYRSTNPEALAIEGTGLGLAIVAEVVTGHGGSIQCRSALGEGTSFEVRLPLASQQGPLLV